MDLNNKVFSERPATVWVGTNALEERLDSYYYNPTFIKQYSKMSIGNMGIIGEYFNVTKLSGFEYTKYFTEEALKTGEVVAITSRNVGDSELNIKEGNTIKIPKNLHEELKRSKLNNGDIVLSYTGHYRRAAVITDSKGQDLHLGPNVCKLSPNGLNIDSAFLCAYLNSYPGQVYLDREKTISAQPTVNMERIRNIKFPLPGIEVQNKIGNKIRKADKLREEAEQLKKDAQDLIMESLNIEDLKRKIHTPEVEQKWSYVKTNEIADRLDSEYYKKKYSVLNDHLNELRKSGIQVLNLKDIINQGSYGILPNSSDYGKGDLTFIRSTDLNDYMIDLDFCEKVPMEYYVQKARVSFGEILLEIKGALAGAAIVPNNVDKAIVNGSIYKFSVKKEFNNYYILATLQSLIGELQKEKFGANSVISYLSLDVINNLQVPILDKTNQELIGGKLEHYVLNQIAAKDLIKEAKEDVESLIEGTCDKSVLQKDN